MSSKQIGARNDVFAQVRSQPSTFCPAQGAERPRPATWPCPVRDATTTSTIMSQRLTQRGATRLVCSTRVQILYLERAFCLEQRLHVDCGPNSPGPRDRIASEAESPRDCCPARHSCNRKLTSSGLSLHSNEPLTNSFLFPNRNENDAGRSIST